MQRKSTPPGGAGRPTARGPSARSARETGWCARTGSASDGASSGRAGGRWTASPSRSTARTWRRWPAAYDKRKAEIRRGYQVSPGGRTEGDVFAAYLEDAQARGLKPATLYYYRQARARYSPDWLLATKLKDLRPEDWRRAQSALHARGLSANTIRNTRVLWNAAMVFAVQNEWLGRNPLDAVKAPKRPRPALRWPTTDEQEALLDAAEAAGDPLAALWRLGASGGLPARRAPGAALGGR